MKKHSQGFTLIEVLVALIILAIAMLAIITATDDGIRDTSRIQNKIMAHWVAMNVISKIQTGLLIIPKSDDTLHGKNTMLGIQWRWKAKVGQSSSQYYKPVIVDVYRGDHHQRLLHLTAFARLHQGVQLVKLP